MRVHPMNTSFYIQLARLRLLVGYLGEQHQYHWWSSAFLTASSLAFLSPIFSKTAFLAQYHGVKAAASRVHDAHIGLGKVYHLFRLPERLEQALYQQVHDHSFVDTVRVSLSDKDAALASLATYTDASPPASAEGPVLMGTVTELGQGNTCGRLAHQYWSAFTHQTHVYPYYGEQQ
ncbi:MAG: BrxE family protein [Candidatus Tectimicrobiota bacterium]